MIFGGRFRIARKHEDVHTRIIRYSERSVKLFLLVNQLRDLVNLDRIRIVRHVYIMPGRHVHVLTAVIANTIVTFLDQMFTRLRGIDAAVRESEEYLLSCQLMFAIFQVIENLMSIRSRFHEACGACELLMMLGIVGQDMLEFVAMEFTTTSFLRGVTFTDSIVIVDEMQNMTFQELDTVMTRIGENCRIIFCGDFRQTDLDKDQDRNGLHKFMNILHKLKGFEYIEFGREDIVRSSIVKDYIIARHKS